jgi:hypothetical protein
MPRNESEAIASARANRKRLNDASTAKAGSEPLKLFLVHVGPGVEALLDVDL